MENQKINFLTQNKKASLIVLNFYHNKKLN